MLERLIPSTVQRELTQYEVADILTQVLGTKISYVPMEIEPFKQVLKDMGFTPHFIQHISAVAQDCRDGPFIGTNDLVEKLTGQEPMQMLDYITKNKALFVSQQEKYQTNPHIEIQYA
jgi:NAD(P)H dehydrogenase (quinone)